jgi:hypothetical protein
MTVKANTKIKKGKNIIRTVERYGIVADDATLLADKREA